MSQLEVFWWLVVGHFIADYTLQIDFIAIGKSRFAKVQIVPWYYVLTAHAMTHAAAVKLVTGSTYLAILEFIMHWIIDAAKNEGITDIHQDQTLHIMCKLFWVGELGLMARGG